MPGRSDAGRPTGRRGKPVITERCQPARLLDPRRLDVVVKFLLFRALLSGTDDGAVDLYRRHITRRTGGFEDAKASFDDYLTSARSLLASLQGRGFDPARAVRIGGRNDLPLDGAHRIAASLALGIDLVVERIEDGWGGDWGADWFQASGFSTDEIDLLVRTYVELSPRSLCFVFWGPSQERWDALSAALARETAIVATRDISLDRADITPLVEDIYAWSLGPLRHQRISEKGRALSAGLPALRVVVADTPEGVDVTATDIKRRLRGIAGHGEDDFWMTVHATDDAREARYVVDLLFNANYRRVLAMRRGVAERSGFLDWLDQYGRVLAARGIANDDACIVGSAVLEAIGLRDSTDIDCVIAGREPRFHAGVVKLGPDVDLVTRGYHRRADGAATLTDAQVIADPRFHFRMRGLKFANPELVIDRKRQHGRPKDLADVALWDERLSQSEPRPDIERAVVWLMPKTSGAALADVERVSRERARGGELLVVVALDQAPAGTPFPWIEQPPPVDRLPADLFVEADPCGTLVEAGLDPAALLALVATHSGPATDPGHSFRRLTALAWTVRWLRSWWPLVRPHEVIGDEDSVMGVLMRTLGNQVSEQLTSLDASAVVAASRQATELTRLVTAAARRPATAALEAAGPDARAGDWWRMAAQSHRTPVWIWGAGSAGRAAIAWLLAVGGRVAGVVDGDPSKHGLWVGQQQVSDPAILSGEGGRALYVAIASIHAPAIRVELGRLGVSDSRLIVLEGCPPEDPGSMSQLTFGADATARVEGEIPDAIPA